MGAYKEQEEDEVITGRQAGSKLDGGRGGKVGIYAKGAEESVEGEVSAREDLPETEEAPSFHFLVVAGSCLLCLKAYRINLLPSSPSALPQPPLGPPILHTD